LTPTLSVVLVSYHSRGDLERCLPSLARQGVEGVETIVVDHAPGDGTGAWLAEQHPHVRVVPNPANPGYGGGNNLGLRHARGAWTLVLNPDTELRPGALTALLAAAEAHPDALVTAKLLHPDGTVNACGNVMHPTGITVCGALGEPAERYRGVWPVPLVSGAAFIARTDLLRELGSFDETYFMYLEDADLSLRARARGHAVLCAADAEVMHHYDLAMTPAKLYWLERNRWLTLLKNYERVTLWRLAPALALTEAATWAFALLRGPPYLGARWRAAAWLWREHRIWRAARAATQAERRVPDAELLAGAPVALPFAQLVSSPRLAGFLDRLTTPLYRLALPRAVDGRAHGADPGGAV
jgi:GT2 family glycosyltransferase